MVPFEKGSLRRFGLDGGTKQSAVSVEVKVGFPSDPPVCVSLILCQTVSLAFGTQQITYQGQMDVLETSGFPVVAAGCIAAAFSGVLAPFTCDFFTVAYPNDQPLGVRQLVGKLEVPVPQPPSLIATVFVSGVVTFAATGPGRADIRVEGNGVMLGMRPVVIVERPHTQQQQG